MPRTYVRTPAEPRFWAKVDKSGECWEWTASLKPNGYGSFVFEGRTWYAHRLAYTLARGEIPHGLQLDHLCRNRACVNPDHLEPVTCRVNLLRGETLTAARAAQTHCVNGHEFTPATTYIKPNGCRNCIPCQLARNEAVRRRQRERKAG